ASPGCSSARTSTAAGRSTGRCTAGPGTTRRRAVTTPRAGTITAATPTTRSGGARERWTTGSATATRSRRAPTKSAEPPPQAPAVGKGPPQSSGKGQQKAVARTSEVGRTSPQAPATSPEEGAASAGDIT